MRKYCDNCGKEVETKIITKRETYDVCGESIEVDAQVLVCVNCIFRLNGTASPR